MKVMGSNKQIQCTVHTFRVTMTSDQWVWYIAKPRFMHACVLVLVLCNPREPTVCLVSCPDPPRTCEKEGLVTQVQVLGLASEFESGQ